MSAVKQIEEYTQKLIENQIVECEWNDKMVLTKEKEEFEEVVLNRSKEIRRLYQENMEMIDALNQHLEHLTAETANALYETARALHLNGRVDPALICKIADPVIVFFKENHLEEDKLIILSTIRFADAQDYYNRMITYFQMEENLDHARWIIGHRDRYLEFEDIRVRRNIINAYTGMIAAYTNASDYKYVPRLLEIFEEAKAFCANQEIEMLEGDDPNFMAMIETLNFWLPWEAAMTYYEDKEFHEKMMRSCEEYRHTHFHEEVWNEKFLSDMLDFHKKFYEKEIPDSEALNGLLSLLVLLPKTDWEKDQVLSQYVIQSFGMIYLHIMRLAQTSSLDMEAREQYVRQLNEYLDSLLVGIPYQYNNSYINALFLGFFTEAIPNIQDPALMETLIDKLMLHRQASTFFHSQMVGDIAALIAEEIIAKEPALFTALPEYPSVKDVADKKEELLESIRRAAKMHDLGKCAIASVIMQQSRKIYDEEFECIKVHPATGALYLKGLKGYEMYYDIAYGHHRTYDGKRGYPVEFDNTASKYRFMIDLISISDSADAATDITGRNYTAGKDFKTLLLELEEGAGTRYNPDIVRVIANAPELIVKLTALTGEERISHLYEVYRAQ